MSGRQALAAGVTIASLATVVLIGWTFDNTIAKSVMAGWRVMVPGTAASFVLIGTALMLFAGHRSNPPNILAARSFALLAAVLPLITFIEYMTGLRTGIENWFGVRFDAVSPIAGRMSPLSALCLLALGLAIAAATSSRARLIALSRIASGSTLLTAWLAMIAIAFDVNRLEDVPRFPGMAVLTIALLAIASWGTLSLTFDSPAFFKATGVRSYREGSVLALVFVIPLLLGLLRDAADPSMPQQVVTALLIFALTATLTLIVWHYGSRMAALRKDRESAFVEMERRVAERTGELASRNAELRLSEDRLREADRRKDEFLATLAHELRNPLAPIRTAVAILRSDHVTDGERRDARTIIDRQVAHMARLIDDLLDVSRITAGKLPMRRSRIELSEVLNLALGTVQPHLDRARHRLTLSMPPEAIIVDGDEARLSQVFANLLHNACKYTEPGGEIVVAAVLRDDREVAITVRDNGIGISEEFLPRVFEKFSQVAPALARSQGGLGLGLSLVHGIVQAHGGRVEARSGGVGRGSEFIVRLPVASVSPAAAANDDDSGEPADRACRRVMVVDDNIDSAESMALLLRLNGHVVETAHDGETALAVAERFQPNAMLLDLGMPKLNGFDVCRRIRSTSWGGSVLLIAQTGWGQAEDRVRTSEAGFDAHLTKPIDPAAVQEMLANLKPA